MADQGKWFKLHCDWDEDPHIDALSLEDQVRWVKFGTHTKKHGTEGKLVIVSPARALQNKFRVSSFEEVINTLRKFPNYVIDEKQNSTVSTETNVTVSILNWHRYQGDFSSDRVRKFRAHETAKKRGEEKRGEEKKITNNFVPPTLPEIEEYVKTERINLNAHAFFDFYEGKGWLVGKTKMKNWRAAARLASKSWAKQNQPELAGIPQWMQKQS